MSRIIYGDSGSECFLEPDTNVSVNDFIAKIYKEAKYAMFYKPIDTSLIVGTVQKNNSRGGGFVSAETIDKEKNFSEQVKDVRLLSDKQFNQYRIEKPTSGELKLVDDVDAKIPFTIEQLEYLIALMFQIDSYKDVYKDNEIKTSYKPSILTLDGSLVRISQYSFAIIQVILKYIPKTVREKFSYFCGAFNSVNPLFIDYNFNFCITNNTELFQSYTIYTINDLKAGLKLPNGHNVKITPYIKYLASVICGERKPMHEMEEFFDSNPISYEYNGQLKAYDRLATIFLKTEALYEQGAGETAFYEIDDLTYEELDAGRIRSGITLEKFDEIDEKIQRRIKTKQSQYIEDKHNQDTDVSEIYKMKVGRLEELKTQIALLQKEQAELTLEIEQLSNQQQLGEKNGNTK